MKLRYLLLAFVFLLVGCTSASTQVTPSPTPAPATRTPGPASIFTTRVPDVQGVVNDFLSAWKAEDYPKMYGMLCLLYTSPSPRDYAASRMPSSA